MINYDGLCVYPCDTRGIIVGGGPGISSRPYRQFLNPRLGDQPFTAWDYRGTGRSNPAATYSFEADYRDFCSVIDRLYGDEPVTVAGHSYGCALALRLVSEKPQKVSRLILIGGALNFTQIFAGMLMRKYRNMRTRDFLSLLGISATVLFAGPTPDRTRRFLKLESNNQLYKPSTGMIDSLSEDIEISMGVMFANRDFARWNFTSVAADIKVPALVICGEQDRIFPQAFSQTLANRIHGSHFLSIPDCGHWPFFEQPERFVEGTRSWSDGFKT
jgi:3-oxoadipate enol-lactonase